MVQFEYHQNINTLEIKETGKITFDNKIKILEKAVHILKNNPILKILHVIENPDIPETIEIEKLKKIVTEKISKLNVTVYHAVIYNNPKGTAYSIIYEQVNHHPNYRHRIFSTKKAAEKWLESF